MIIFKKRNFRLDFECERKELGLGLIIFKPIHKPFPRKNSRIGITIRLLWFGIFFKILGRKQDTTAPEIYEQKEIMKEISAFHHKELIVIKNHKSLDAFWQWNHLGVMIYHQSPKGSMPGIISLDLLWLSISFDFSPKSLLI